MFAKTLTLAAAALLATTTAVQAQPVATDDAVTATYHFGTKRFCVRSDALQPAERAGPRVAKRQCMSRQQWRQRGIVFVTPLRGTELARS